MTVKEEHESPEFRSVKRDNKMLQQAYLDTKDGADVKYRVKHNLLEKRITRNLTINSKRKVFGKTVSKMPPACVSDKSPCSLEKRMRLSRIKRVSTDNSPHQAKDSTHNGIAAGSGSVEHSSQGKGSHRHNEMKLVEDMPHFGE